MAGCRGLGSLPPVGNLRDGRACGTPLRAFLQPPKARCAVPIIRDGELPGLTNRANTKTEGLAAPGLKRTGGVKARSNQLAAHFEDRRISADAKAIGFATARADKLGANRNLRKSLVACNFRDDLPPKLVTYGSPVRPPGAGAFR